MEELVVGDVILVEAGKSIPADCVLIQSEQLQVDESTVTGESESVQKEALQPHNYQHNP
jgi:Ca2+-transporting ATPase